MTIHEKIEEIYPIMVAWRRQFHQKPELSFKEYETSDFIFEQLQKFGLDEVNRFCGTSVVGLLKGTAGQGKCIAIRADIDALPIMEQTGYDFASETDHVMHACGHDGHTAILLATAKILSSMREQIKGSVKFIFQSGEELLPGGAKPLVEAGVMEAPHVDAIIALHLLPSEQENTVQLVAGAMTEGGTLVRLEITGAGGHVAQPHKGQDVILAGSEFIVALQQIVTRFISPDAHVTVCSAEFHAGTQSNNLPQKATISVNPRYYDSQSGNIIRQKIKDIADGISKISGCRFDLEFFDTYPYMENDAVLTELVKTVCTEKLGMDCVQKHFSGGDDFGFYPIMAGVPGTYFLLWAGYEGDTVCGLHDPAFTWNEETMKKGVRIFIEVALKYLSWEEEDAVQF